MLLVLGIDPGMSGGLAVVEWRSAVVRPELLAAIRVPTMGEGPKARVDAVAVIAFIQMWKPDRAVIERAQAMPILRDGSGDERGKQGASSAFKYGRAVGYLEACVLGMQIPLDAIESTAWKKAHGLSGGKSKEDSRQRALMLWPGRPFFKFKADHNVAEAALIAHHGGQRFMNRDWPAEEPRAAAS